MQTEEYAKKFKIIKNEVKLFYRIKILYINTIEKKFYNQKQESINAENTPHYNSIIETLIYVHKNDQNSFDKSLAEFILNNYEKE